MSARKTLEGFVVGDPVWVCHESVAFAGFVADIDRRRSEPFYVEYPSSWNDPTPHGGGPTPAGTLHYRRLP